MSRASDDEASWHSKRPLSCKKSTSSTNKYSFVSLEALSAIAVSPVVGVLSTQVVSISVDIVTPNPPDERVFPLARVMRKSPSWGSSLQAIGRSIYFFDAIKDGFKKCFYWSASCCLGIEASDMVRRLE